MAVNTLLPRAACRQTRCRDGALALGGSRLLASWEARLRAPGTLPVAGLERTIHVKIASSRDEWEQALRLVADNYRARGYESPVPAEYRFTPYHALPTTVVLVAMEGTAVVATFSLVADNTLLGLPLENLYPDKVQDLRRQGRRIFETTCLADRNLSLREFVPVFRALIRLAWQYGTAQGGDTNAITVNPRHVFFYTRALGYVPLGARVASPSVQGHPAEAFFVTPTLMRLRAPAVYEQFFGAPLPAGTLTNTRLPPALLRELAGRSTCPDMRRLESILREIEGVGSARRW